MKQMVTTFRAEGEQADRPLHLCRIAREADLLSLRNSLRQQARSSARLTAYVEFIDEWSMGDVFARVMGDDACRQQATAGELHFRIVTPKMRADLLRQEKQRHQCPEQTTVVRILAELVKTQRIPGARVAVALFREILGATVPDQETIDGSNTPLEATV